MRRRAFLLGAMIATPFVALAQRSPGLLPQVGILAIGSLDASPLSGLVAGLAELGYVDGRTVMLRHPPAQGSYEALQRLALDLVASNIAVLVTFGGTASRAAASATRATPIVMVAGVDPVALGWAHSLAHPGANVTGIATVAQELMAKRVELMREIVPDIVRVAVLLNADSTTEQTAWRLAAEAGRALGIETIAAPVHGVGDLEPAFASAVRSGAQGMIAVPSTMLADNRTRVASLAARHGLPAVATDRSFPEAGGLMAYGPNFTAAFHRAAAYVDKILRGAKPAELAIEQPTKFELVVNLKTAKVLGLAIPQSILLRADEVIE